LPAALAEVKQFVLDFKLVNALFSPPVVDWKRFQQYEGGEL
jgi:hypothetical protein